MIERFQPLLWIHGHLHYRIDEMLGETRVTANPYGYGPAEGHDFDPELLVDLAPASTSTPKFPFH